VFVLWLILVGIKMSTFVAFGVVIDWQLSLLLIPVATIGHLIGLKLHDKIIQNRCSQHNYLFCQIIM
jgi:hypothetical protein